MNDRELMAEAHKELSYLSTRELAIYFQNGQIGGGVDISTESIEARRMIIRSYLGTQPESVRKEFEGHLEDRLLGERPEDN